MLVDPKKDSALLRQLSIFLSQLSRPQQQWIVGLPVVLLPVLVASCLLLEISQFTDLFVWKQTLHVASERRIFLGVTSFFVTLISIYLFVGAIAIVQNLLAIVDRVSLSENFAQETETLLDRESLLQLVLDNIPQLLFWKDRNSVFQGCNQR